MGLGKLGLKLGNASGLLGFLGKETALLRLEDCNAHVKVAVGRFKVKDLGLKTLQLDKLLQARAASSIRVLGALGNHLSGLLLGRQTTLLGFGLGSSRSRSSDDGGNLGSHRDLTGDSGRRHGRRGELCLNNFDLGCEHRRGSGLRSHDSQWGGGTESSLGHDGGLELGRPGDVERCSGLLDSRGRQDGHDGGGSNSRDGRSRRVNGGEGLGHVKERRTHGRAEGIKAEDWGVFEGREGARGDGGLVAGEGSEGQVGGEPLVKAVDGVGGGSYEHVVGAVNEARRVLADYEIKKAVRRNRWVSQLVNQSVRLDQSHGLEWLISI